MAFDESFVCSENLRGNGDTTIEEVTDSHRVFSGLNRLYGAGRVDCWTNVPVTGDVNVKSAPVRIANLVDWIKADSPIYNGYTALQNLPMGTTPKLVFHDFQSGYPTTLQASIRDNYTFAPALPANHSLTANFSFIPAFGAAVGGTSTFQVQ